MPLLATQRRPAISKFATLLCVVLAWATQSCGWLGYNQRQPSMDAATTADATQHQDAAPPSDANVTVDAAATADARQDATQDANTNPCVPNPCGARTCVAGARVCAARPIDLPGTATCGVGYPALVLFTDAYMGFAAGCGGPLDAVGIDNSATWPFVIFRSTGAVQLYAGDSVAIDILGFASGSTGTLSLVTELSSNGTTWAACGSTVAKNYSNNVTVDRITCNITTSATQLYVRLKTSTASTSLIYVKSIRVDLTSLCQNPAPYTCR